MKHIPKAVVLTLALLFCTACGSTRQAECVDALSNTENSRYSFELKYEDEKELIAVTDKSSGESFIIPEETFVDESYSIMSIYPTENYLYYMKGRNSGVSIYRIKLSDMTREEIIKSSDTADKSILGLTFSWSDINKAETAVAIEKQQKLIKEFQKWVWEDDARKERLERIFENNFSCIRRRIFDGSFLRFPDMSAQINLYPYQKDAVARIIFTPNTLLAHDVGAGKTYVMIAAAMEMRRMGLSEKNMFVVPNNIVGQWKNIFREMYPSADILCVDPKSFAPSKRESVLERIRDNDFDGIIIAYSCFEQIPLSKGYYQNLLIDEQKHIAEIAGKKNKATSRLKKKQEAVSKALSELAVAMDDLYNGVYLDDLGITRLFVDEAHNFKNVPLETKTNNVLGINSSGSKRCQDMMDKVHMIQKKNDGKGIVLATGTLIITGYLRSQMPILRCLCRTASQDYVVLFCFFGVRLIRICKIIYINTIILGIPNRFISSATIMLNIAYNEV